MLITVLRLGSPRKPDEGLRLGTVRRPPRGWQGREGRALVARLRAQVQEGDERARRGQAPRPPGSPLPSDRFLARLLL